MRSSYKNIPEGIIDLILQFNETLQNDKDFDWHGFGDRDEKQHSIRTLNDVLHRFVFAIAFCTVYLILMDASTSPKIVETTQTALEVF